MRLRRARGRTCAAGGALKDRNKRNFRRVRPHRPKAPVSEYRWAARCYRSARPRPGAVCGANAGFFGAQTWTSDRGPRPRRHGAGGGGQRSARRARAPRRGAGRAGGACGGCARAAPARRWNGVFRRLPRAARATRAGRRVTAPTGLGSATRPGPGEARIGGPGRKIQPGFKPGRPTLLMAHGRRATRAAKRQARRPAGPRSCPVGGRGPARISWARRHRIRVLVRRRIRRYRRARVARVSRVSSALNTVL